MIHVLGVECDEHGGTALRAARGRVVKPCAPRIALPCRTTPKGAAHFFIARHLTSAAVSHPLLLSVARSPVQAGVLVLGVDRDAPPHRPHGRCGAFPGFERAAILCRRAGLRCQRGA